MTNITSQYLLIGNGRVARHFTHYLALLGLPYQTWQRTQPVSILNEHLTDATHVLLLISDHAIEAFAQQHLTKHTGYHIHFSGALISENVIGAHPLQTFTNNLYDLERYQQIPFVIDADAPVFEVILPGLQNQHVRLTKEDKAKYHALCVLSGNFSCLLWQKLFTAFESEFNIPKDIAYPYLRQQMQNLLDNSATALTGPLVRDDKETINKNLLALEGDEFKQVYTSFVRTWYDYIKPSK